MMMTRVERMIYDEAKKSTEEIFGKLICRLLAEKRYNDLRRASEDSEYREKLYREYELTV